MNVFDDSELTEELVSQLARSIFPLSNGLERGEEIDSSIILTSRMSLKLIDFYEREALAGNQSACVALEEIACRATQAFQDSFLEEPDRYGKSFVRKLTIPVMYSNQAYHRDLASKIVERSGVGKELGINTEGKQGHSDISKLALDLYVKATNEIHRRTVEEILMDGGKNTWESREEAEKKYFKLTEAKIPRLTKENAVKLWWPVCQWVLHEEMGKNYEEDEFFEEYWTKIGIRDLKGKAQRNEVRKRIRNAIKQSLKTLAVN
jgi:hypothetical protein